MGLEIINTEVRGLERSMKDRGFPMRAGLPLTTKVNANDEKWSKKLGRARPGTGHDCFLKGIVVWFHIKAPGYFWPQLQRYHFLDFISSQSKMHSLTKMDPGDCFPEAVTTRAYEEFVRNRDLYIDDPTQENLVAMVANCPMGHEMWASMVTNYMQLKTIVRQRRNHKLPEWKVFCDWAYALPRFSELTGEG